MEAIISKIPSACAEIRSQLETKCIFKKYKRALGKGPSVRLLRIHTEEMKTLSVRVKCSGDKLMQAFHSNTHTNTHKQTMQ